MLRRVVGDSMLPFLREGDVVLSLPLTVRVGDVTIAQQNGREVIKRVTKISNKQYFLLGDNMASSTDSRKHGTVAKSALKGRVMAKFPRAEVGVAARSSRVKYLSFSLAAILAILTVLQLASMSDFVTGLGQLLPATQALVATVAIVIVLSQILAVPYLLQMKLSPLGHIASGVLSVIAPLSWSLIGIWGIGTGLSTAILADYVTVTANWLVVALLLLWLAVSYLNLYLRNFEAQYIRLRKLL